VTIPDLSDDCKKKLVQVTASFDALDEQVKAKFAGNDVCFNCLGTTRKLAGGADGFVKIEVDFTATVAAAAHDAGIPHFSVISAQGANPNQWGKK
jgi:oxidoreductase